VHGDTFDEPTPEELVAYADGEASPTVRDRIRANPALHARATEYERVQARARGVLYRFECPPPQTLGEYALDAVTPEGRTHIAAHIVACPRCADEVQLLRSFLATDPLPAPVPLGQRLRRVIAALVSPTAPSPVVGLRGGTDAETRTYRADDFLLTLDTETATPQGRTNIVGLLWREGAHTGMRMQGDVALVAQTGEAGAVASSPLDELGNFAFDDVTVGTYRVEVTLGDTIIVVEGVRVGSR